MKTKLFTILISITINSQTIPIDNTSEGSYEPAFKYKGYLYCKHFASGSTTPDGLYKISFADKTKTQIAIGMDTNNFSYITGLTEINYNPQFYNDDIFLNGYSSLTYRLDTENNILLNAGAPSYYFDIHEDYLLTDGANGLTSYKDLRDDNSPILPISQMRINFPCTIQIGTYYYFNYAEMQNNQPISSSKHLGKLDENGLGIPSSWQNIFTIENAPQFSGFYPKSKPLFINDTNRLIYRYTESGTSTKWKYFSIDINNGAVNTNLLNDIFYTNTGGGDDYILTNDGVIFFNYSSKKFYKTNGKYNAIEKTDMPSSSTNYFHLSSLFKTYDESNNFSINVSGNSFINIGNTTYFRTTDNYTLDDKIWKINGIDGTPELIASYNWQYVSSPIFATNWQNNLIYYNPLDKKIYKYDGTKLSADTELNTRISNGKTSGNYTITGLIADGDRLLINTSDAGMFVLDKTLSTQEPKTEKISIYPNPVKDILYFTEEVSNIKITDISGKRVCEFYSANLNVNLSNLPKGIYIISAFTKVGKGINQKIIKE